MCNNNWGGCNCCWIIILLIIVWFCCGNNGTCGTGSNWSGCGCGGSGDEQAGQNAPQDELSQQCLRI